MKDNPPAFMYRLMFGILLISTLSALSQSKDKKEILQVLNQQSGAWNRGDIDSFMQGYWKNDSLMFVGKGGVTRGWQQTLTNYKRSYPDTTAMGKLSFDIVDIKKLSSKYYYVIGKWTLSRSIGNLGGHFTLLFKKVNNYWVIISDHTS